MSSSPHYVSQPMEERTKRHTLQFNTTVGSENTDVNNFRMIGPGPGNNLLVHDVVHLTINANGTVTASVDQHSFECK